MIYFDERTGFITRIFWQENGPVDIGTVCWRCGGARVIRLLRDKWAVLLRLFYAADAGGRGRIDPAKFKGVLDRADVGMSEMQVVLQTLHPAP